jgi:hypothetical protein
MILYIMCLIFRIPHPSEILNDNGIPNKKINGTKYDLYQLVDMEDNFNIFPYVTLENLEKSGYSFWDSRNISSFLMTDDESYLHSN